jgi:hypothetical protein
MSTHCQTRLETKRTAPGVEVNNSQKIKTLRFHGVAVNDQLSSHNWMIH